MQYKIIYGKKHFIPHNTINKDFYFSLNLYYPYKLQMAVQQNKVLFDNLKPWVYIPECEEKKAYSKSYECPIMHHIYFSNHSNHRGQGPNPEKNISW